MKTVLKFLRNASGVLSLFVAVVVYAAVGEWITMCYGTLTATETVNLTLVTLFGPAFLLLWAILARLTFKTRKEDNTIPGYAAVGSVAFLSLPIVFNGISIALHELEWKTASMIFFALRFWSLLLVPLGIFVASAAYKCLPAAHRFQRTGKPPTTPPSS